MFATCVLVTLPVTTPAFSVTGYGIPASGAVGAVISDGAQPRIRGRIVDDNLTIPLVSAFCMSAVVFLV